MNQDVDMERGDSSIQTGLHVGHLTLDIFEQLMAAQQGIFGALWKSDSDLLWAILGQTL